MALLIGINFRATSGYVTDPADTTYCLDTDSYPTTRGGATFGWEDNADLGARNRNDGIDARLAGINFRRNDVSGTRNQFRLDLDASGDHDLRMAIGDATTAQSEHHVDLQDTTTTLETMTLGSTSAEEYFDATSVKRTSASDWVSNNAEKTHNFSTTILRILIGLADGSGVASTSLAHLNVEEVAAGAAGPSVGSLALVGVGK